MGIKHVDLFLYHLKFETSEKSASRSNITSVNKSSMLHKSARIVEIAWASTVRSLSSDCQRDQHRGVACHEEDGLTASSQWDKGLMSLLRHHRSVVVGPLAEHLDGPQSDGWTLEQTAACCANPPTLKHANRMCCFSTERMRLPFLWLAMTSLNSRGSQFTDPSNGWKHTLNLLFCFCSPTADQMRLFQVLSLQSTLQESLSNINVNWYQVQQHERGWAWQAEVDSHKRLVDKRRGFRLSSAICTTKNKSGKIIINFGEMFVWSCWWGQCRKVLYSLQRSPGLLSHTALCNAFKMKNIFSHDSFTQKLLGHLTCN